MRRTLFAISSVFLVCFSWLLFNAFIPSLTEEFGKANYYSDSLHGRKTSSGEKYDKNELTCAHKSLPFGARVKVTRLDNKKSVIVRVNDRGPFKEGYVIELSRRAAEVVDLVRDGSASVRVEVVPNVDTKTAGTASASAAKLSMVRPVQYSTTDPQPSSAKATSGNDKNTELYKVGMKKSAKSGYGVQLSTLYDADNLLPIITKLQQQWPEKVLVSVERDAANDLSAYRVMIGPFADEQTAKAQQKLAVKRGYKQGFVVDLSEI
ncbi:MAG: septal ring lytic transglycosylase RlpA family protein [Saprospiraceae bacterium]|nr:septal ring lytic transglycosylase RlpA family protein [Saprospiraceae bacterium]